MLAECHYCGRGLKLSNVGMYISSLAGSCFMVPDNLTPMACGTNTLLGLPVLIIIRAKLLKASRQGAIIDSLQDLCSHRSTIPLSSSSLKQPSCRLCCLGIVVVRLRGRPLNVLLFMVYIYIYIIAYCWYRIRYLTLTIHWQGTKFSKVRLFWLIDMTNNKLYVKTG